MIALDEFEQKSGEPRSKQESKLMSRVSLSTSMVLLPRSEQEPSLSRGSGHRPPGDLKAARSPSRGP